MTDYRSIYKMHYIRGLSANAMLKWLIFSKKDCMPNYPHDMDDFNRCVCALNLFPGLHSRLSKLQTLSDEWKGVFDVWEYLTRPTIKTTDKEVILVNSINKYTDPNSGKRSTIPAYDLLINQRNWKRGRFMVKNSDTETIFSIVDFLMTFMKDTHVNITLTGPHYASHFSNVRPTIKHSKTQQYDTIVLTFR